jgi:tetratricopeptide (TPR) repeat protein
MHMILLPLLLALAAPLPTQSPKEVRAQFVDLAAKKDHDACLALWKSSPGAVLPTIDADLEGSLKVREKSAEPDMKAIATMHARALWGAQIAFEASGDPMILDYASAFVGWEEPQRKRFREGQAAFRTAMNALKPGDAKTTLASGQQCLECASPLGDWWGTAMGYDAIAAAQKAMGDYEKALEAASRARAIYHSLGLEGDEYSAATAVSDLCMHLKRAARGKAACQIALALAKKLGDADGEKSLTAQMAALDALTKPAGK